MQYFVWVDIKWNTHGEDEFRDAKMRIKCKRDCESEVELSG
jgi:hypothetical protein